MGRELKRKQAKKEGKLLKEERVEKQEKENENPYNDIYKLLKTFGIILGIVILIHLFTALVITKEIEWFKEDEKEEENIPNVANSILAKNTFMQKEEEYYVYFYDFEDENDGITFLLNSKLTSSKIYKVNTNDAFNSNFVTEEVGNSNAKNIDELKVISPTLIKVSNDTIVEYYDTTDGIKNYLESK